MTFKNIDPDMSGEPCFSGTQIPLSALLDYLDEGKTVDEFIAAYGFDDPQVVYDTLDDLGEYLPGGPSAREA